MTLDPANGDLQASPGLLETRPEGLTGVEVEQRRSRFGPNCLPEVAGPSLWGRLWSQFCHRMAHLVAEQASTGDMLTLLKLGGGRYSLVEAEVGLSSSALGRQLTDLKLPEECILVGILRQRELMLPRGQTMLQPGDQVLALTHQDHCDWLRDLLEGPAQRR